MLHAYRCGHRVFARWMREAVSITAASVDEARDGTDAVAELAVEYTDAVSTILAAEYVTHTRLLSAVAGDQRAELLRILLEGHDESDGRLTGLLRDAGYLDRRQSFCVVLARSVDPAEMQHAARARRLADAVDAALARLPGRRLIEIRDGRVAAVCALARRQAGWTRPRTALASQVENALIPLGPAVLVGIGNDAPSSAHIPGSFREAQLALELADVSRRVMRFADIALRELMVHLSARDVGRVLPPWSQALFREDEAAGGALIATLRAFARADMNVLKAAKALALHPNTVYARVQRIQDACGLDARSYHALTEMLLAADCRPGSETQDGQRER